MENEPRSTQLRSALIEAAARLIAAKGAAGMTLRGLAEEVGTSTMAVYTHFGGMPELRRAVRREGLPGLPRTWRGCPPARTRSPMWRCWAAGTTTTRPT